MLAQTAAGPSSLFNLCIADKTSFADVDLSVAFKAVAGKKDQGGGLLWRCKDANNYYVVRHNPLEDNFRLYKVVDGKRIQLATSGDDVVAAARASDAARVFTPKRSSAKRKTLEVSYCTCVTPLALA